MFFKSNAYLRIASKAHIADSKVSQNPARFHSGGLISLERHFLSDLLHILLQTMEKF